MSIRSNFRIIKAFYYPIYEPVSQELVAYQVGEKVTLRENGSMAKKWLAAGYIQKV